MCVCVRVCVRACVCVCVCMVVCGCGCDWIPTCEWEYSVSMLSTTSVGNLPRVSVSVTRRTTNSIALDISRSSRSIGSVIVGIHRLDFGQPVLGRYTKRSAGRSSFPVTFPSLVPGAKYRITAWGLESEDMRRSRSPTVVEVTTMPQGELLDSLGTLCMVNTH